VDQEEVLIALMFDDFMATGMKSLDYDRVVRNAVTIQSDPDVCKVLNAEPIIVAECWVPEDDWITDMCFAFTSTEGQLTARSYPTHDITPPAMTMLVYRGSEKRTGIKNRRPLRPKQMMMPLPRAPSNNAASSSSAPPEGQSSSRPASAAGTATPEEKPGPSDSKASPKSGKTGKGRKASPGKSSPKSAAKAAASLLADPRAKPTGGKQKKIHV